jgi:glycosyltransferase involved in cell wall biosynthesis
MPGDIVIRVLHVLDELRLSGVERLILTANDAWNAAGIITAVAATGPSVGPAAQAFRSAGIEVHHLHYRPRPGYIRDLASLARSEADIIQFHTERAFIYSELACRAVKCAVIHSPCSVIKIGGFWRLRRIAQRWLARRADIKMITIGDSVHDHERKHFKNPSRMIRNFIDTGRFVVGDRATAREVYGVPSDHVVLCSVGNCLDVKNHRSMFEALAAWGSARSDWTFLHVGHEIVAGERDLVRTLGIDDRCQFLGPVNDPESVLQASDVFVMPSLGEGLSIAALEAAACGLVLVLADVTGLRDLKPYIEQGTWTGTDTHSITAGISWAANRSKLVASHQRSAQHDIIIRTFGVERGAAEYASLYHEIGAR